MAVQLSSSYLKRSYQLLAKLCVGEMGAVQAFERSGDIVYKWARKKFKNIFRQIPAEKTTLDDKRDGNEIGVIVDQDRARFILRAVHPDANIPGRMWITDVQLNRSGNDCLLAVGDENLIKIHFHTNEPWQVLEYCAGLGEIFDIVVEDMDRQARGLKG